MSGAIPPGPRGGALLGSLPDARRDPLAFVLRVSAEYGDIVHVRLASLRVFLLNHPDDIEQVLVSHHHRFVKGRALGGARRLFGNGVLTSDGDLHSRQRRLMQPAFQRNRLAPYGNVMTPLAVAMRDGWRPGSTIDIAGEMSRLTLEIAAAALFGPDAAALTGEVGETLETATSLLEVPLLPLAPVIDLLPLPHVRRLRQARARVDAALDELIARRRRRRLDTNDLLSLLLVAREREHMSDRQLRDELTTILLASHETTANALAFAWYLIATHPGVETRLHREIDGVLSGRSPSAADVPALPYTRMILAESMRLFPPAWLLGRVAADRHEARGYVVPAGSIVVLSPWAVQRNDAYFPEPERFDPDRWHPERVAERPKFSYFPFGGGSRGCLGESFAWTEGVLVLAVMAQRLRFLLADGPETPELLPAITLKPRRGIRVVVEHRSPRVRQPGAEEVRERTRA